MLKKFVYNIICFICVMVAAFTLGILFNPIKILNKSISTFSSVAVKENSLLKEIYDVNFIMTKQPSGNTNIFLPKMVFNDFEQAAYFSEFFGINRNFIETEDSYTFSNEKGTLTIDKFGGHLSYSSGKEPATVQTIPEDSFIISSAFRFAKEHLDYFDYEEAEITLINGIYELYFIERFGNLKNYAFPTHMTLDLKGNVLSMDYYFTVYERLSSSPIKSMEDAFWELPIDLEEGIKVDLKKCSLVYYYADSIVQPCYMFEGETSDNKGFKAFVKAAIFE